MAHDGSDGTQTGPRDSTYPYPLYRSNASATFQILHREGVIPAGQDQEELLEDATQLIRAARALIAGVAVCEDDQLDESRQLHLHAAGYLLSMAGAITVSAQLPVPVLRPEG